MKNTVCIKGVLPKTKQKSHKQLRVYGLYGRSQIKLNVNIILFTEVEVNNGGYLPNCKVAR